MKVLMKLISLYIIRDILEVNIVKNPMPLGLGVSVHLSVWIRMADDIMEKKN